MSLNPWVDAEIEFAQRLGRTIPFVQYFVLFKGESYELSTAQPYVKSNDSHESWIARLRRLGRVRD